MKKAMLFLNIIMIAALAVLLTGCWNYRDINELDIVAGLAIDKCENGNKYLATVEIVDVQSSGKDSKIVPKIIQTDGETLFDAMRNMIRVSGKRLYFSHMKVVIISQDIAREGVTQTVDWILRDNEPRLEINIVISKEKTARELLEYQSLGEDIVSYNLYEMLKSQKNLSKSPFIEGYKFVQSLFSEGESAILPTAGSVDNEGGKTLEVSGAAVFKKDKLVGFLNDDDTKYLLFIENKVKSGVLPEMKNGENTDKSISLEIFDSKTKIRPEYSNGKISINIDVKMQVGIDEHSNKGNFIDESGRNILERWAEKSLEDNIKRVIRKVQDDYDADIFGFGKTVKIQMPWVWRNISSDWDNIFKDLDVKISTKINIRSSGFLNEPLGKGE